MSEKFVTKLEWEKWKLFYDWFIHKYCPAFTYDVIIDAAKNNRIVFGELGNAKHGNARCIENAVKRLIEIVPPEERLVRYEDDWGRSYLEDPSTNDAYRIHPEWQPPEEPKELVGWDWLQSLGCGAVVKYKSFAIHVFDQKICVIDSCGNYYSYERKHALSLNFLCVSASNSKIIWQEEKE